MTLTEAFTKVKSDLELNQSFQNIISTRHKAIRGWIEKVDPAIETKLIGSLQRKTRIQPINNGELFDIDILVILGSFSRWAESGGITPTNALENMETIIKTNTQYKKMGPETDSPTISVEYSDNVIAELVPAYRDQVGETPDGRKVNKVGRGYWIPKNNKWVYADYDYDAEYISNLNNNCANMVIPTIKMLKCIKRNLIPDMSSYHLEVLATNILPRIITELFLKSKLSFDMIIYNFFKTAQGEVNNYNSIEGSNSIISDSTLDQTKKDRIARLYSKITEFLDSISSNVTDKEAIKKWYQLFGQPFSLGV